MTYVMKRDSEKGNEITKLRTSSHLMLYISKLATYERNTPREMRENTGRIPVHVHGTWTHGWDDSCERTNMYEYPGTTIREQFY